MPRFLYCHPTLKNTPWSFLSNSNKAYRPLSFPSWQVDFKDSNERSDVRSHFDNRWIEQSKRAIAITISIGLLRRRESMFEIVTGCSAIKWLLSCLMSLGYEVHYTKHSEKTKRTILIKWSLVNLVLTFQTNLSLKGHHERLLKSVWSKRRMEYSLL
jgi:hypothetical protein